MALTLSFGQGGKPAQWYLPGTPIPLLPPGPSDGEKPVADALTAGPFSPGWDDALLFGGLVMADTLGGTAHGIDVVGGWNSVKNAFAQSDQAEELRIDGVVQVDIDVGRGDPGGDSRITVIGAKRGNITTGAGDDIIRVELLSNETTWSTAFRIATGAGDDVVVLAGLDRERELAAGDMTYASFANGAKGSWNTSGEGMQGVVDLGAGNDRFIGHGSDDTVTGGAGNDLADGGAGTDTWTLSGLRDGYSLAHADGRWLITDTDLTDGSDGRDDIGGFEKVRFGDGSEMALPPLPAGLVLWNRLGSAEDIAASEIGPAGTLAGGTFVPGVFGGAWRATGADASLYYQRPPGLDGLGFPASVINAASGTIEFWARLEGFSGWVASTGTMPGLVATIPVQDSGTGPGGTWVLAFTANDGGGGHGLSGQAGDRNFTATNATFTPTYEGILGGDATGWHHYAFAWDAAGFAALGQPEREVMLFLDGVPVSSHWEERVASGEGYGTGALILPVGEVLALAIDGPSWPAGTAVAFDNLKVWSVAKTDFSDRFDEDATDPGSPPPPPLSPIQLADIAAGQGGFKILGEDSGQAAGWALSGPGDVNGDGLSDLLVGAYLYRGGGNDYKGAAYVVFGKADTATVDLDDLAFGGGSAGFRIIGEREGDHLGWTVAGAGDVNGDGRGDLVMGIAPLGRPAPADAYVVFGKADPSPVDLATVANGGSTLGFKLIGETTADAFGQALASAGDLNGDGRDELLIGAYGASGGGRTGNGVAYVIAGKPDGGTVTVADAGTGGAAGFTVIGEASGDQAGRSVAGAGDVNGDGQPDLLIGAYLNSSKGLVNNGAAYVLFGPFDGAARDLAAIGEPATAGFKILGEAWSDFAALSVSAAGDVNGDGLADVLVGAILNDANGGTNTGAAYVVFGKRDGGTVDLRGVARGEGGFKIAGEAGVGLAGHATAAAGDVNGDGLDDLLIGARGSTTSAGAVYLVFGKADGMAVQLDTIAAGTGRQGIKVVGESPADRAGYAASGAGDVNGDGLADILIGASLNDSDGSVDNGAAYVIFGQDAWLA